MLNAQMKGKGDGDGRRTGLKKKGLEQNVDTVGFEPTTSRKFTFMRSVRATPVPSARCTAAAGYVYDAGRELFDCQPSSKIRLRRVCPSSSWRGVTSRRV